MTTQEQPTLKVGDMVRDFARNGHWTVAAVFSDDSIMTAGHEPLWLDYGEYELLNACGEDKHFRDLRRYAYAEPTYMTPDDPRALSCRRELEGEGMTTIDARNVIENRYYEKVYDVAQEIVYFVDRGDFDRFRELAEHVDESLESLEYTSEFRRAIEAIYVSGYAHRVFEADRREAGLSKQEYSFNIFTFARRCVLRDLMDVLKDEFDINLEDSLTLEKLEGSL